MLHFCSNDDISAVFPAATRLAGMIDKARKSVTTEFNNYIRRRLDWETGIIELLDANDTAVFNDYNVWLLKKAVDPTTLRVYYSRTREFDNDDALLDGAFLNLDADKGMLRIAGRLYAGSRILKIAYDGGYKAIGTTDVMACPDALRDAAVDQAVFNLKRTLGQNQGQAADSEGKKTIAQRVMVGGLLSDAVQKLMYYRKPLGGGG